ncbi:hypothetical protein DL98DRAFT_475361 [Cadophora sp. DSE1049]|nr:hypothetical protein DL98DRAFT_475361 [Cadophora sp. DSE1049]
MDEAPSTSNPRRYTCPDCSRHYQAKETLQRHRKNHSRRVEHVCEFCDAGFYRKDLLLRHFRIHQGSETSEGQSVNRQRSRRACDRCSRLKIKCSSSSPCTNCERHNNACNFSNYNHSRASLHHIKSTASSSSAPTITSPQNGSIIVGDSPEEQVDSLVGDTAEPDIPGMLHLNEQTVGDTMPPPATGDDGSSMIPRLIEPTVHDNFSFVDTWPQNMTWPWLHEEIFLQYDPQFDLDSTGLSPPGVNGSLDQISALPNGSPETQPISEGIPPQDNYASRPSSTAPGVTNQERPMAASTSKSAPRRNQQQQVVAKFVDFACNFSRPTPNPMEYRNFLDQMCVEIEQAFGLQQLRPRYSNTGSGNLLDYFVELFLQHFHPLWPLFWSQGLAFNQVSPLLYITLTSVGSVYASGGAATYAFMCHEKIRETIILAPLQSSLPEEVHVPLCQSLLLIQASTLYFGQRHAFSIAQQLAGIIVCHARKMNLFNDGLALDPLSDPNTRSTVNQDEIVYGWLRAETRKRLAFGILRAEVFISQLLNSRSLVSYEEFNIQLPCPITVWKYNFTDLRQYVMAQYNNQDRGRELFYSDLVRIARDRNEALPKLLPGDFELLLFGIQQIVWQFSHDLDMMSRLSRKVNSNPTENSQNDLFGSWSFSTDQSEGNKSPETRESKSGTAQPYNTDLLDCSMRDMNDLKIDYQRCFSTLRKWKRSFAEVCTHTDTVGRRNSLLASRLLYHISFIRISADVQKFHLCSHQLVKGPLDPKAIHSVYQWASSQEAKVALEHACAIWSLISREVEREESTRAKFNILTHIALYHAASVVWAYAGTHRLQSEAALDMIETSGNSARSELSIHRSNTAGLVSTFAALVNSVTPAWKHTSSFATVISMMAARPFPILPGSPND